jgi:soluble lytic murein transglycosylase-like protein
VEIALSEHIDLPAIPAAARITASALPPASKLSDAEIHELLAKPGAAHDLDVDLLASVVKQESDGQVRAVSRTGARGLMQLMPGTAAQLGVGDSFAASENVSGGTAYLDSLLKRYHDNLALALAAYNAGPGAVDRWRGVPPYRETRAYVARVIREFNRRIAARQHGGAALTELATSHP